MTLVTPGVWWLLLAWITATGACFGSFMNVVIYRVPAGLSISYPPSRCPKCLHPIRGYDNIPVLSWMILRGKCRDCGNPISARYPSVEALVAFVTMTLALTLVFPGTADLSDYLRVVVVRRPWILWSLLGGHVLVACTLICAALIDFDRQRMPLRLFVPAMLVGGVFAGWFPEFTRLGVTGLERLAWGENLLRAICEMALGAVCGVAIAPLRAAWESSPGAPLAERARPYVPTFSVIALWLGWPVVVGVTILSTVVAVTVRLFERDRRNEGAAGAVGGGKDGRSGRRSHSRGVADDGGGGKSVDGGGESLARRRIPLLAIVVVLTIGTLIAWRWLLGRLPMLVGDLGWTYLLGSLGIAVGVAAMLAACVAEPSHWSYG
ncbi:MAG TPA: prepilin peptidase, partial [Pirellulaceae bacterium]|nr:prepilin peptidase [Pirellulaceae bacterium]